MKPFLAILILVLALPATAAELTYRLRVDGLACAYCAYGIEKTFMKTDGVQRVDIDFDGGYVLVDTAREVRFDDEQLRQIVHDSGFTLRGVERVESGAK